MKSFNEWTDWEKETGYVKSSGGIGSGGRGGTTEHVKGNRAMIDWVDKKGQKYKSLIPPIQYKPAKNKNKLKGYIKNFIRDVMDEGGSIKKIDDKQ
jgi:hypothetical protein